MASLAPGPASVSPAHCRVGGRRSGPSLDGEPQAVPTHLVPVGPAPVPHRSPHRAQQDDVEVFGYPVQIGKIQPPLLPEETLRRDGGFAGRPPPNG